MNEVCPWIKEQIKYSSYNGYCLHTINYSGIPFWAFEVLAGAQEIVFQEKSVAGPWQDLLLSLKWQAVPAVQDKDSEPNFLGSNMRCLF